MSIYHDHDLKCDKGHKFGICCIVLHQLNFIEATLSKIGLWAQAHWPLEISLYVENLFAKSIAL